MGDMPLPPEARVEIRHVPGYISSRDETRDREVEMAKKTKSGAGQIRVGIGGWTFEPWRGTFSRKDLAQKRVVVCAGCLLAWVEWSGG
jgi:hypothetical protein